MFMWTENIKESSKFDIPPYTYKFEIDTDENELLKVLDHVVHGINIRAAKEIERIYREPKTENGITKWKLTTKDHMVAGLLEIACEICKDRSDQKRETQRQDKVYPAGEVTIEVKTEGLDEAREKVKALCCELEAARELADKLDERLNAFKH